MPNFSFEMDSFACLLVVIFLLCFYLFSRWSQKFPKPKIYYSNVQDLESQKKTIKELLANLPPILDFLVLTCLLLAFINLRYYNAKQLPFESPSEATEGIAIYLILDQSSSMAEAIEAPYLSKTPLPKIEVLKKLTTSFIKGDAEQGLPGRPNDLIGVVQFARVPRVLSPLTLDHLSILNQLKSFDAIHDKKNDGTGIGYAIYKTAHLIAVTHHGMDELSDHIKPVYKIKNTIMILVTDGIQKANPLDQDNPLRTMDVPVGATYAKEQGIRLYIVNLEPKMTTEEYSPFRHQMEQAAEKTGGKFFSINNSTNLLQIYSAIDKLEKSKIPWNQEGLQGGSKDQFPELFEKISLYPYFLSLSLFFLLVSVILNTTVARKIP